MLTWVTLDLTMMTVGHDETKWSEARVRVMLELTWVTLDFTMMTVGQDETTWSEV